MDDVIKKMLDEIYLDRKSKKCALTTVTSVVNMDFASLYTNQMKWWNITPVPEKVIIRKTRIKRIFQ
jgi:DNA polymerase elongation subunit (family B)